MVNYNSLMLTIPNSFYLVKILFLYLHIIPFLCLDLYDGYYHSVSSERGDPKHSKDPTSYPINPLRP